ncbi:hypothetical protein NTE_00708 [Candidatus Nitrososphaera evergladensis SR1]|uniref:Uncharacterized protein n=1 Tax=Candidatus Nitrososphaera evergladensis SR1 TaxID=1459636 RepID=A0A075MNK4_9ARCH|nr:hypothetical protein NTE_00708 [Candidatus Nitrososphaera evergladensis SR1]
MMMMIMSASYARRVNVNPSMNKHKFTNLCSLKEEKMIN